MPAVDGVPDRLARYSVRSKLGQGGFALVVLAHDEALDALVAVKVLDAQHADDPTTRERFVREGQLLRRVRSRHVIGVHDIGELDDGRPYLVMELATGGVLADRLAGHGPVDAAALRATIAALAQGLGALHASGIVHRDIKPGNLLIIDDSPGGGADTATVKRQGLLGLDERVVVGDLGLAKDQDRTHAEATVVGGTPGYRSPEQTRRGEVVGVAADVYGATALLFNLLTGEPPPEQGSVEAQLATVPTEWRHVLGRGLAPQPEERFAAMSAWEAAAVEAMDADAGARDVRFRAAQVGATCPYKGLSSYQPEDATFFYGREAMIDELVARLHSSTTLVIGGPSGSGKSSLLRAGLLPAVTAGALPGSQHWPVLLFTPGDDPVTELSHQLGRLQSNGPAPTARELHDDPLAIRRWLPSGTQGLLAIDQFEEVFTSPRDPAAGRAFVETLAALCTVEDAPLRVVIALRSDFYSRCANDPWLAARISENQMLVGPMGRPELRQAIEGPAQRAGLRLEAGLTESFLDEAGDEPGGLPLIAHALMETWMRRRGAVLTIDGFNAAGGVAGAIAQSAEQAYTRLTPPDRASVRQLFLRLVTPGEDTPDTRRRLSWEDLDPDERMSGLIEQLARDRLLTVDERGVELVHETLIHAWPRLADWIDEARDDLRMHQRVARAAAEWSAQDRDSDLLYRGVPLANVLDWQDRAQVELTGASAAYVEASREAREAEEQAITAAQKRRRRVRTVAFSAVSVLAVAALAASLVAFVALGQSRKNETEAEERFARGLATQSDALASASPKLALALAAESAARVDPIPPEAQRGMATARQSLSDLRIVPYSDPIPVGDVVTSVVTPDGSTLMTGARDGTVRLWDTVSSEDTATLTGPRAGIEEAAVDPGGRWLVTVGADGLWRWDLTSDDHEGVFVDQGAAPLWSVAFSPDGDQVVTAGEDGVVQSYDTSTWKPRGEPFSADVDFLSVAFTPDGARVLAGTGDGRVFLWDAVDGSELGAPIEAHGSNDVWELAMDPTGRSVATGSSDGTARVWSLEDGSLEATPFVDAEGVRSLDSVAGLAWSPDGASLWASGDDGLVHEWDRGTGTEVGSSAIGHADLVSDASMSSDGTVLATLGRDQDVRLWDIGPGDPTTESVLEVEAPLFGVAVSSDGSLTAAGDEYGVVHLVDAAGDTIELEGHEGRVFGVAFLPDDRLVTVGDDGSLRLWDTRTGRTIEVVDEAAPEPFTSVAVAESGETMATSSADGVIRVWSVASPGAPLAQTPPLSTAANKVVFTPSGDLAAAYGDGMVRFWDQNGNPAGEPLQVDSDRDAVHSVAVADDGQRLAAATGTDGVTLWDLGTRSQGMELNGQPVEPVDVVFTPDGGAFVSSTRDGVVSLWNTATGQAIGPRFEHHDGAVWRIAVAPHSGVVTAGVDGTVQRLDVLDIERACALGAGSLDRRARNRYLGDRQPIGCN